MFRPAHSIAPHFKFSGKLIYLDEPAQYENHLSYCFFEINEDYNRLWIGYPSFSPKS